MSLRPASMTEGMPSEASYLIEVYLLTVSSSSARKAQNRIAQREFRLRKQVSRAMVAFLQ